MPRRIFPSLRRRRIRIDTAETRLLTLELTDSCKDNDKLFAALPIELYVELSSVILSAYSIRISLYVVNSSIGIIFYSVNKSGRYDRTRNARMKRIFTNLKNEKSIDR